MSLQYNQSREVSAALLKLVIAELGRHEAPFDPISYALWYEHHAGINPALSKAVLALQQKQPRLSADQVRKLHHDHVAEPDDTDTQSTQTGFLRVMDVVVDQASATGREASDYGSQLALFSRALQADDVLEAPIQLNEQLSQVEAGTSRMQSVVAALAQAVAAGRAEMTELRQALDRSRVEATTDALSQLLNRKGFDDALREVLRQQASGGRAHCLVVLDIDHFKRVNDAHGHPVGDSVIQTVGQLMNKLARGEDFFAARIGGEEFAVLCRNSSVTHATQLAQGICALVRGTTFRKRGTQEAIAAVTISAGVAACVKGDDAASLLASADAALYRAKAAGRDRVVVA